MTSFIQQRMMQKSGGFTLIEWLIVLMIIGLLAFIAVPNVVRTRISIREQAMQTSLRTFHGANEVYRKTQNPPAYAANFSDLIHPELGPSLLDASWERPSKHGYALSYQGGGKNHPDSYSLTAKPASQYDAKSSYCLDHKGVVLGSQAGDPLHGSELGCQGGVPIAP